MSKDIQWRIEIHDVLSSTNDYCKQQAELNQGENLAICARKQTQSRASRGRNWQEPEDNLALSFLYWPHFTLDKLNWIPFISALALYDAITPYCSNINELRIKWPNDLLYNNRKLAGILIESNIITPNILQWLIIGIGLNRLQPPNLQDRQAACMKEFSNNVPTIEILTKSISKEFSKWLNYLIDDQYAWIREQWINRGLKIGTLITVKTLYRIVQGIYKGIDENGFLLLATQEKIERLSVAEIF